MDNCPTCNTGSLGQRCARLSLRGTGTPVDAALCSNCGTVYVPEDEFEQVNHRLNEWIEDEYPDGQTRLDRY